MKTIDANRRVHKTDVRETPIAVHHKSNIASAYAGPTLQALQVLPES